MGASGLSLTVSGDGDREGLHEAIWEHLREVIDMYVSGDAYRAVIAYLIDAIPASEERGGWGVVGDDLLFMFPDHAGAAGRSKHLWAHLAMLAAGTEWARLEALADERDLEITSASPSVTSELSRGRFALLRGELWLADDDSFLGDDTRIPVEDLDASERERHAMALAACQCGMCTLLRPEDKPLASILAGLDSAATASSAGWYLSRIDAKRADVLLALIRGGARDAEGLGPAVERYAQHLGPELTWEHVAPMLGELRDGAKALALRALDVSRAPGADTSVLVREVLAALPGDGELAAAAAEIAGHLGRAGDAVDTELADAVAHILDRDDASEQLRNNAVLGLVNLHLPRKPLSPATRERLEREAKLDTEAGKLATWMLSW